MGLPEGKVAVITGGSRGLGMAIAKAYAREGAAVVLGSRAQAAVDEAVAELTGAGARAGGLACDVGDLAQVEALSTCKGADGPTPLQNAYAPSKAWVASFTRALVKEYAGTGIDIHLLQPGLMLTDMVTRPEAIKGYVEKVGALGMILRLLGNPPEVPAEKALWLASAATDRKTGVEVHVLRKGGAMGRFLKAGLRRLTGGRIDPVPLDVKVVKPR